MLGIFFSDGHYCCQPERRFIGGYCKKRESRGRDPGVGGTFFANSKVFRGNPFRKSLTICMSELVRSVNTMICGEAVLRGLSSTFLSIDLYNLFL